MSLQARIRMMQLASQALPIGGYSHSQGLEAAIEAGIVCDEPTLRGWMADVLRFTLGRYELPMLRAFNAAWQRGERAAVARLNQAFLASRESAELRSASVQMGFSLRALVRVLPDTPDWLTATLLVVEEPALPCVWSGLASAWGVSSEDSLAAFAWSWAENQVLVAVKTVPLGQSMGQRVLLESGALIAQIAADLADGAAPQQPYSNFAPALAILSAQHETQYSRLFRS